MILILLASTTWNYVSGILIQRALERGTEHARRYLFVSVAGNLALLFYYKYFVFFTTKLGFASYFPKGFLAEIIMPIGISFFTFHGISYLVDIFRKEAKACANFIDLALYISFFPQLIAGPIIKYHDIHLQLKERSMSIERVSDGICRLILGLAKKIILANNFAVVADEIFKSDFQQLAGPVALLGVVCYTLQIYFDFSGYSDMAIGLGKIMGFDFKENFNYPYIAKSIQEFWRRWHISLSTWFKEYVYIPLGGNRKGTNRMLFHLLIVFILTGFWHGASYNFLIWGLLHGFFLIIEKIKFPKLPQSFEFLRHLYVLSVVMLAWVFFRIEDLDQCLIYLDHLFTWYPDGNYRPLIYLSPYFALILLVGILFATPLRSTFARWWSKRVLKKEVATQALSYSFYLLLFAFCLLELSSLTYNPFIYYRF